MKKSYNVCIARPHWDGCDYCDNGLMLSEHGKLCWKQDSKHWCVKCVRKVIEEVTKHES